MEIQDLVVAAAVLVGVYFIIYSPELGVKSAGVGVPTNTGTQRPVWGLKTEEAQNVLLSELGSTLETLETQNWSLCSMSSG